MARSRRHARIASSSTRSRSPETVASALPASAAAITGASAGSRTGTSTSTAGRNGAKRTRTSSTSRSSIPYRRMRGRRRTSAISEARAHDATGVTAPRRIASRTRPGGPSGRIRPETQTFVSTTTRRTAPPNLADRLGHVPIDVLRREVPCRGDVPPPGQEILETALPLGVVDDLHALGSKPLVQGRAHELRHGLAPLLAKPAERLELHLGQIDVRALHRLYTIHQTG